jgi:glutamate-1-semialdehyde 2,1-aminomutase
MSSLLFGAVGAGGAAAANKGRARLALSRAKHPSLAGHARLSRRVAAQIPFYAYDDEHFFRADGADAGVAARRRAGFDRLAALYASRFAETLALTAEARSDLSDLQFTGAYRVPFQFGPKVRAASTCSAMRPTSA